MNNKTNVLIQNNKEEEDNKEASEDLSSKLLKTRTIIISSAVDSKLAQKVIQQILLLEQESPDEEIKIMINSPGGEVTSGFGIFDTLRFVSCPITTIVSGLAASMGSILSLAGDKGRKFAFPNAEFMIHQPLLSGMQGQVTDLEIQSKSIQKTKNKIAQMYADQTGKSLEQVLKDIDRNYWLDADDAVEYKLIDKIITSRKDLEA
ncbi:MAG: ATP-dependent Clp protease protease subunit [bacterium]|jgi:ATP-dependent Clp protease protease subunit